MVGAGGTPQGRAPSPGPPVAGDSAGATGAGVPCGRCQPAPQPWCLDGALGRLLCGAAPSPGATQTAPHLLVESLVLYPTLPEVLAGFWRWGKVRKDNFLFLKEKDKESGGGGGRGAQRAACRECGGRPEQLELERGTGMGLILPSAAHDAGGRWGSGRHLV